MNVLYIFHIIFTWILKKYFHINFFMYLGYRKFENNKNVFFFSKGIIIFFFLCLFT